MPEVLGRCGFALPSAGAKIKQRDLKIPRFRVRVWVGLPVTVVGYTGNQSNLRYTGWHQLRSAQKCKGYMVFRMPSKHRLKLDEKYFSIRFNYLFCFLRNTTNMSSTQKWKKPRLLLTKSFSQEVSFQVNIKYLIWIKVFFIVVYGLLHFKSIWNVSQLNFGEETTPQSSRVLESSMLFDRQKFIYICISSKLFRSPKTLQIRKTCLCKNLDTILV